MAYNKFIKQDGTVMLDLTSDTVTADTLNKGVTAHNASGELIVGTNEDISDSPLPIEISNETEMKALLTTADMGAVYKYVGDTTDTFEHGGLYIVEAVAE